MTERDDYLKWFTTKLPQIEARGTVMTGSFRIHESEVEEFLDAIENVIEEVRMAAQTIDKAALQEMGCYVPNCEHDHSVIYLVAECHPKAGTRIKYVKSDELMIIQCCKCGKEVIRIRL